MGDSVAYMNEQTRPTYDMGRLSETQSVRDFGLRYQILNCGAPNLGCLKDGLVERGVVVSPHTFIDCV